VPVGFARVAQINRLFIDGCHDAAAMGAPTPPLALSATNLAMLQARQPTPPTRDAGTPPASGTSASATPPSPPFTGRGRLVDIIA
jgi:hypothetical protein